MTGWFKRWFSGSRRKTSQRRTFRPALEALEERLVLNTYTVINTNPSGIGSLPYEYSQAQSGDTINFSTIVNGQTIDLGSSLRLGLDANGQPNGKTNLSIDGSGVNVTLSGGNNHRIIEVADGSDTIKNLTFTNGKVTGASGGAILVDSGAGLTLNNDTFTSNSAIGNGANGGAIENDGNLTVASSYFYGNSSAKDGAAIDSNSGGSGNLAISTSDFDGNNATGNGGAISTADSVTLRGNQFTYNTAGGGGGAISTSALMQLQSTSDSFENNTASGAGGAISTSADTTLTGDTFQSNTAQQSNGGAVYATAGIRGTTSLTVSGSTFTGNQSMNAEGGAIYTTLITSVQTSTFNNNYAAPRQAGGAIEYTISNMNNPATPYDSSLQLSQDMFSGNSAVDGGAVSADIAVNSGLITVSAENSTFYQNSAQTYGGAFWYDSATSGTGSSQAILVDDTFFRNSASDKGGGLGLNFSNAGTGSNTVQLTSLTVYQNNALNGGGGVYVNTAVQGGVTVDNNIFDGNLVTADGYMGPEDVLATNRMLTDTGYNLVGTTDTQFAANSDISNNNTGLAGSLAANGAPAGYPPTLAFQGGIMPGVGTGDPGLVGKASPLGTDARGFIRQANDVSIGAYDPNALSP